MSDTTAATVQLSQTDDDRYKVKQVETDSSGGNIDWSYGPIKNTGNLDLDTLELEITPTYMGIEAGVLKGNIKDGMRLDIDYQKAKGEQRWYLRNGNEVWTHFDIKITFNGSYQDDKKILTF
ncbi:hypothetical protein FGRMN_7008 [Fusarium graminum]|nr:hypothetical protein FGRMN_7008 [Fusarium graminum]